MKDIHIQKASETQAASVLMAIDANEKCQSGFSMRSFVVISEKGPSGDKELLAFIHAASATGNWPLYWYAHVMAHPGKPGIFASSLIKSEAIINGRCAATLLERFHFWIIEHGKWSPACFQAEDETYCESVDFDGAVHALTRIVAKFDELRRDPPWDIPELGETENEYSGSPCDMRPWEIYARNFRSKCEALEGEELIASTIIPPDRCSIAEASSDNCGAHLQLAGVTVPYFDNLRRLRLHAGY